MKILISAFFFILFLSCEKENVSTPCIKAISYPGFEIKENRMCFHWNGYDLLVLDILDKKSGKNFEKLIDHNNSCVDYAFEPEGEYILTVSYRCYNSGNYQKTFYKDYHFKLCKEVTVSDYVLKEKPNGRFQLQIEPINEINLFDIKISHDGSDFGLLSYFANDFTILPGYKYKIEMKPVCQLGELQYSYGNTSTSFEFDAGEAVLKHELPSICKPINCDTIDLPLLISASNNNIEKDIPYQEDSLTECQIYFHRIVSRSNPSKKVEFYMTISRDNQGGYMVYYLDDYCSKPTSPFTTKGISVLKRTFGPNEFCEINFYKKFYQFFLSTDFEVFRKRVL